MCVPESGDHLSAMIQILASQHPGSALREAIASQSEGFVRRVGGLVGALTVMDIAFEMEFKSWSF